MSRHSKKIDLSAFNVLLVIAIVFLLTPVVPFAFLLLFAMYLSDFKGKYAIAISLGIFAFVSIFSDDIIKLFLDEFKMTLQKFVDSIIQSKFNYDFGFLTYKSTSWIVIFILALLVSGYFKLCIDKIKEKEKAGIIPLEKEIKRVNKTNKNNLYKEKPCKCNFETDTFIGYNKSKKRICVSDEAKHIFVSGTTGSGKTVVLSNFVKSACMKNYGALIIDGKGDEGKNSLLEITKNFCSEYKRKLYVVSMNDPDESDKYNPFAFANETVAKDMLINMTDWSEEHYKTNTERYIQRLIKLLMLSNCSLDFNSIIEHISADKFIELSKRLVADNLINKGEHTQNVEIAKASAQIADSASSRFSTIAESQIGKIFDSNGIDIYEALREKAIIIFVLNPLLYPETSKAMGRLILIDSKKAVSKLFKDETRKFFIFDEINVYASSALVDLINKSRSANVTCIPATQSLSDLEDETGDKFKNQIIENCNNYIVLRQNSFKSAEDWAKTLGTRQSMEMTYQMNELGTTKKGSSRRVREFIVHPDDIKSQGVGEAVYMSRDKKECQRVEIYKPF